MLNMAQSQTHQSLLPDHLMHAAHKTATETNSQQFCLFLQELKLHTSPLKVKSKRNDKES